MRIARRKSFCSGLAVLGILVAACGDGRPAAARVDPATLPPDALAREVVSAFVETPVERAARLGAALRSLRPENLEAVLEVFGEHMAGLGELELQPFFDAWVGFDPVAASQYAEAISHAAQKQLARKSILNSWAARDPIAASAAADQLVSSKRGDGLPLYRALVRGWARSGQEGLQEYILEHSLAGQLILSALPGVYYRAGPEGLMRWANHFIEETPDLVNRIKVFRMAVRTLGFRRPRAAIPFVLEHWGHDYAAEGPRVLTETWLRTEPEAGLEWLRTEAPEKSRSGALRDATGRWLSLDRAAARAWLESRPAGDPYYHPAFAKLAQWIAKQNPEEAIDWCMRSQIEPPDSRCLHQAAVEWYKKDPVSAGTWLEKESMFSVEDRIEVRERATRKKRRGGDGAAARRAS